MNIHIANAVALGSLLVLGSCGSSESSEPGPMIGTFNAGTVPEAFAVMFSERTVEGRLEPYVVDLETGTSTGLGSGFPTGKTAVPETISVSPNGRIVGLSLTDGSTATFVLLAVSDGASRTLPYSADEGAPLVGAAAPARFEFSPSSEHLYFSYSPTLFAEAQAYLMNVDGTGAVRIGQALLNVEFVGWSADSSSLLLSGYDVAGDHQLVRTYSVPGLSFVDTAPVSGEETVFDAVDSSADGSAVGVVTYSEGATISRVRASAVTTATGTSVEFATGDVDSGFMATADDGSYVAFVTLDPGQFGTDKLMIGTVASGVAAEASISGLDPAASVYSLAWEPTGNRLIYVADHMDLATEELFLTGPSSPVVQVQSTLPSGSSVGGYVWSPAGRYIAFLVDESGTSGDRLYLYDADSAAPPSSLSASTDIDGLVWSPDGEWLYARESNGGGTEPMVVAYSATNGFVGGVTLGEGWSDSGNPASVPETQRPIAPFAGNDGVVWHRQNGAGEWDLVHADPLSPTATAVIIPPAPVNVSGEIRGVVARHQ